MAGYGFDLESEVPLRVVLFSTEPDSHVLLVLLHHVAGDDCYLMKVRARDAEHIGQLLRHRFGRIPGVVSTRTTIVLETVKETPRLPLRPALETVR